MSDGSGGCAPTTTTCTIGRPARRSASRRSAPQANRMDLMAEHLRALAAGTSVSKPTYDHHTGTFGDDEVVEPGEIVIVEGLLPLAVARCATRSTWRSSSSPTRSSAAAGSSSATSSSAATRPRTWCAEIEAARARCRAVHPSAARLRRHHRAVPPSGGRARGRPPLGRVIVRPTLPYPALRELLVEFRARGDDADAVVRATDRRGPDERPRDRRRLSRRARGRVRGGRCGPTLHPDERLHRDRIGDRAAPGPATRSGARRSRSRSC